MIQICLYREIIEKNYFDICENIFNSIIFATIFCRYIKKFFYCFLFLFLSTFSLILGEKNKIRFPFLFFSFSIIIFYDFHLSQNSKTFLKLK